MCKHELTINKPLWSLYKAGGWLDHADCVARMSHWWRIKGLLMLCLTHGARIILSTSVNHLCLTLNSPLAPGPRPPPHTHTGTEAEQRLGWLQLAQTRHDSASDTNADMLQARRAPRAPRVHCKRCVNDVVGMCWGPERVVLQCFRRSTREMFYYSLALILFRWMYLFWWWGILWW